MKVLADIAKLEKYYHDNGRIYRNYNTSYYTIYTRLLSNFAILSPSQIEEYYRKATGLLASDPAIRETYDKAPMADGPTKSRSCRAVSADAPFAGNTVGDTE